MSLTGRPNSPPSALVSSSQIFIASNAALPLAARPPVNPMPKPILIGSTARAGAVTGPPSARPAKRPGNTVIVLRRLGMVSLLPVRVDLPILIRLETRALGKPFNGRGSVSHLGAPHARQKPRGARSDPFHGSGSHGVAGTSGTRKSRLRPVGQCPLDEIDHGVSARGDVVVLVSDTQEAAADRLASAGRADRMGAVVPEPEHRPA